MPQLDTTTFPSQLFWLCVCFVALYFLLSWIFIPKIAAILAHRESVREEKINQASFYREQAEGLLIDYEKTLAQARKDAQAHYHFVANATAREMEKKRQVFLNKLHDRFHIAEQELYRKRLEVSSDLQPIAQEIADKILKKLGL